MLPLCRAEGIGVIPWSPLARGLLAGNRRAVRDADTVRAKTDEYASHLYGEADLAVVDRVIEVAKERGVSPAQIALAWVLSRPGVTAPIVGASKPHHLEQAIAALDLALTDDESRRLEEPYRPHAVKGH